MNNTPADVLNPDNNFFEMVDLLDEAEILFTPEEVEQILSAFREEMFDA